MAPLKILRTLGIPLLAAATGFLGYQLYQAGDARRQLEALSEEHRELTATFNEVVRRTAVTELVVEEGRLSVTVRDARGEIRTIPTPFDPQEEIYVDYLVINGRLWIRRVFDGQTPPAEGIVIDPALGDVDWNAGQAHQGKAVYRALNEGRWIISVTGDGSLGLARLEECEEADLTAAPPVRDYPVRGNSR
jgi:hypothetical protein